MKRFVSLLLAFGLSLTLMTAFTSALASGDPVVLYTEKNTQEGWDEYERKIEEATGIGLKRLLSLPIPMTVRPRQRQFLHPEILRWI